MTDIDHFTDRSAKVTMLLADSAQLADGKLFILGGGLSAIGPDIQPHALAILIEVPWHEGNKPHDWQIELLDADGLPVMAGDMPVMGSGQFEVSRPDGPDQGVPLAIPLVIGIAVLPVEAGAGYAWRLAIDGTSEPEWSVRFYVRGSDPADDGDPSE